MGPKELRDLLEGINRLEGASLEDLDELESFLSMSGFEDMLGSSKKSLTLIDASLKKMQKDGSFVWKNGTEFRDGIRRQLIDNLTKTDLQIKNDSINKLLSFIAEQEKSYEAKIARLEEDLHRLTRRNKFLSEELTEAKKEISELEGANGKIVGDNQELNEDLEKSKDRIFVLESVISMQLYNLGSVIDGLVDPDVIQRLKNISEELTEAVTKPENTEEETDINECATEQVENNINRQDDFEIADVPAANTAEAIADEEKGVDQAIGTIAEDTVDDDEVDLTIGTLPEDAVDDDEVTVETATKENAEVTTTDTAVVEEAVDEKQIITEGKPGEVISADQADTAIVVKEVVVTAEQTCDIDNKDCADDEDTADQAVVTAKEETVASVQAANMGLDDSVDNIKTASDQTVETATEETAVESSIDETPIADITDEAITVTANEEIVAADQPIAEEKPAEEVIIADQAGDAKE